METKIWTMYCPTATQINYTIYKYMHHFSKQLQQFRCSMSRLMHSVRLSDELKLVKCFDHFFVLLCWTPFTLHSHVCSLLKQQIFHCTRLCTRISKTWWRSRILHRCGGSGFRNSSSAKGQTYQANDFVSNKLAVNCLAHWTFGLHWVPRRSFNKTYSLIALQWVSKKDNFHCFNN